MRTIKVVVELTFIPTDEEADATLRRVIDERGEDFEDRVLTEMTVVLDCARDLDFTLESDGGYGEDLYDAGYKFDVYTIRRVVVDGGS